MCSRLIGFDQLSYLGRQLIGPLDDPILSMLILLAILAQCRYKIIMNYNPFVSKSKLQDIWNEMIADMIYFSTRLSYDSTTNLIKS